MPESRLRSTIGGESVIEGPEEAIEDLVQQADRFYENITREIPTHSEKRLIKGEDKLGQRVVVLCG